jgi:hypothetical protein
MGSGVALLFSLALPITLIYNLRCSPYFVEGAYGSVCECQSVLNELRKSVIEPLAVVGI